MGDELEEEAGEAGKALPGEGARERAPSVPVIIQDKKLTFDEASKCLGHLGKDETGMRYAYLKVSATDRKLTDVHILTNFRHLLFVDVSGNYLNLAALQCLAKLPFLIQLNAQRNFVESPSLEAMPYLQDLILSRNQIKDTYSIIQGELEYLDLNYNQIYQAMFEKFGLPSLKQLELRGNFLFECGGNFPTTVEKLFLGENRISRIIELDLNKLENLTVLHLRGNYLRKLHGFSECLVNLKYLNLRENKINKLRQFRRLCSLPMLKTLVVSQNPAWGDEERGGEGVDDTDNEEFAGEEDQFGINQKRVAILALLPDLLRINKTPVNFDEREYARQNQEEKYREIMDEESSDDDLDPMTATTDYTTEPAEDESGEEVEDELPNEEI